MRPVLTLSSCSHSAAHFPQPSAHQRIRPHGHPSSSLVDSLSACARTQLTAAAYFSLYPRVGDDQVARRSSKQVKRSPLLPSHHNQQHIMKDMISQRSEVPEQQHASTQSKGKPSLCPHPLCPLTADLPPLRVHTGQARPSERTGFPGERVLLR